jgi:hypothetical protein
MRQILILGRRLRRKQILGLSAGFLTLIVALILVVLIPAFPAQVHATASASLGVPVQRNPTVSHSVKHDVSPPLRTLRGVHSPAPKHDPDSFQHLPAIPQGRPNHLRAPVQSQVSTPLIPSLSNNFDGVGNGFTGPQGTFTVNSAPPDTNGAVGPQDYVQIVNTDFAVFNKDPSRGAIGSVRYGPVQINTL